MFEMVFVYVWYDVCAFLGEMVVYSWNVFLIRLGRLVYTVVMRSVYFFECFLYTVGMMFVYLWDEFCIPVWMMFCLPLG